MSVPLVSVNTQTGEVRRYIRRANGKPGLTNIAELDPYHPTRPVCHESLERFRIDPWAFSGPSAA